jgi:hypothetical protein
MKFVKFSLFHSMKEYQGVEIRIHAFKSSVLDGAE